MRPRVRRQILSAEQDFALHSNLQRASLEAFGDTGDFFREDTWWEEPLARLRFTLESDLSGDSLSFRLALASTAMPTSSLALVVAVVYDNHAILWVRRKLSDDYPWILGNLWKAL